MLYLIHDVQYMTHLYVQKANAQISLSLLAGIKKNSTQRKLGGLLGGVMPGHFAPVFFLYSFLSCLHGKQNVYQNYTDLWFLTAFRKYFRTFYYLSMYFIDLL